MFTDLLPTVYAPLRGEQPAGVMMRASGVTDVLRLADGWHNSWERRPVMITQSLVWAPGGARLTTFSRSEWRAIRALRDRYRPHHDLFSAREVARLYFVRWLYRLGRFVPWMLRPRVPVSCPRDKVPLGRRPMGHRACCPSGCFAWASSWMVMKGRCLPNVYAR